MNPYHSLEHFFQDILALHAIEPDLDPQTLQLMFAQTSSAGPRHAPWRGGMNFTLRTLSDTLLRPRYPDLALDDRPFPPNTCFRKVYWSPNDHWPGLFADNQSHPHDVCFCASLRWFAHRLRAAFVVDAPSPAIQTQPRVLFMARPTSQAGLGTMSSGRRERILGNQLQVIGALGERCKRAGMPP